MTSQDNVSSGLNIETAAEFNVILDRTSLGEGKYVTTSIKIENGFKTNLIYN